MEGSSWHVKGEKMALKDLRDLNENLNNYSAEEVKDIQMDMHFVTRDEYNRKIKEIERKIALLESKLNNDGWGNK